jgi:hypothetical protein
MKLLNQTPDETVQRTSIFHLFQLLMSASEWIKTKIILGYEYDAEEDCVIMRKKNGKVNTPARVPWKSFISATKYLSGSQV